MEFMIAGAIAELMSLAVAAKKTLFSSFKTPAMRLNGKKQKVAIYIHGGMFAPPQSYSFWQSYLARHIRPRTHVNLPRGVVWHHSHLEPYLASAPYDESMQEIHIGHSMGGFISLMRLYDEQALQSDRILKVILVGTPLNPEHLHPLVVRTIVRLLAGVNPRLLPPRLQQIQDVRQNGTIAKKVAIIASSKDVLFPPKACYLEGADYREVKNTTHVGMAHDVDTCKTACSIINSALR
ncbi:MAG: hypothetical protein AAB482_00180 [Patescibacteria group bacterium]